MILEINREKYKVYITSDRSYSSLPRKEFELLNLLVASKPDKVFKREKDYGKNLGRVKLLLVIEL